VFEILDTPTEPECYPALPTIGIHSENPNLAVALKDITFQYATQASGEELQGKVQGINLSVTRGQVAALVGLSGGGKSTLAKLLMGFYPPDSGELWLDGQNLTSYRLSDLRQRVAYVPQDAYLFDGTIEENIAYGKSGATRAEVLAAAMAAHAHHFILEQPQGYDTLVGERGTKLSGGQRQHIAIDRAFRLFKKRTASMCWTRAESSKKAPTRNWSMQKACTPDWQVNRSPGACEPLRCPSTPRLRGQLLPPHLCVSVVSATFSPHFLTDSSPSVYTALEASSYADAISNLSPGPFLAGHDPFDFDGDMVRFFYT
jgi:ABC-type iron transport system FetAB ATPase subunit